MRNAMSDDARAEISALALVVERLREKLGPRHSADLLESFALDLAAEADREDEAHPAMLTEHSNF